jgi:septum formation protein
VTRARALILASTSPRRRMLLREAGFRFTLESPDVDETPLAGESPAAPAERLALEKGRVVAARAPLSACVLAADTLVTIDGDVLGKPRDHAEAVTMLLRLAGRTHTVFTGFALFADGREESAVVESAVRMHAVTRAQAEAYAASGEPLDKAGAYAAQGEGGRFVAEITGSRSNVIGLPLEAVTPRLKALGVEPS